MIPASLNLTESESKWVTNSENSIAQNMRLFCADITNQGEASRYINDVKLYIAHIRKTKELKKEIENAPEITSELFPICYPIPKDLDEIFQSSATSHGYHAVATYYKCPQLSEYKKKNIKPQRELDFDPTVELKGMFFGTLMHCLLSVRVVYGQDWVEHLLSEDHSIGKHLHELTRTQALNIIKLYNKTFPFDIEAGSFKYIGVEAAIQSNIYSDIPNHEPRYRTVRYDKIVQDVHKKEVYSMDHKTTTRGGAYMLLGYTDQFWTQCAIWNSNRSLVEKYGPMRGVIPDAIITTKIPRCERPRIIYMTERYHALALEYLRGIDRFSYPVNEDGSRLHMLHTCFGGTYGPCQYTLMCHDGASPIETIINAPEDHEDIPY